MSSVTRWMVWWTLRRRAAPRRRGRAGKAPPRLRARASACRSTSRQTRCRKRWGPSMRSSLHSIESLGRGREEDVEAQGVGPVLRDHVVGGDGVALRLRHHLAVLVDHPLGEEARHRLVEVDEAEVAHHLRPEARVDEVEDGVLDAAHVEVDREPVRHRRGVEGPVVLRGREVAVEVPGRVDEGVHGVGLAPGRAPALRAGGLHERRDLLERVAALAGEGRVRRAGRRAGPSSGTGARRPSRSRRPGWACPSSAGG